MAGDTVECYNCGNANPAWAQVCRSCGVPIRPGKTRRPEGPFPTDQDSLVAIGTGIGAIVLAVIVGIIVSGMIPAAPVAAESTPTPVPTGTPAPTEVPAESIAESVEPTPAPTPELIGSVLFGTALNQSTREAVNLTDTFGPGVAFCHSVRLSEPFGVSTIQEEVLKVGADGSLTVVQPRATSNLGVAAGSQLAGFCAPRTNPLISDWGVGDFIIRDYRGDAEPELIAEGAFKLTN